MSSIRTRIAPSPTGQDIHVGTIATALINWAWAKKNEGQFVVRIEDTDRTRLVPGGEEKMLETLESIGLHANESPKVGGPYGPYRQSERLEIYKKYAEELIAKKVAYYCTCSKERLDQVRLEKQQQKQIPKYDKYCLSKQDEVRKEVEKGTAHVIRLNVAPDKDVIFNDLLRGDITFNTNDIDDQVLLKSDGYPTYHLAVVVDDYLMKISHIIRAEEWLPSTPKHVLLYQGFGWETPVFVHVSLLRNPDRSKLSKRKNPVWASEYLAQGILPEAFLNYLALMGWSHPKEKELFDLDEYVQFFDIKDVLKTAPVFDPVKLAWMNGEYLRKLTVINYQASVEKYLKEYNEDAFSVVQQHKELFVKSMPLVQERIKKLSEYWDMVEFFFTRPTQYEIEMTQYKDVLHATRSALLAMPEWNVITIGDTMQKVCGELGMKRGDFFMMMRVAISGKKISPPLNESMELLGKAECLARME